MGDEADSSFLLEPPSRVPGDGIRVLISYAHDPADASHAEKVWELAKVLRNNGIEAWIDQYVMPAGPAEGWPRWMDRMIREVDFVVCVCTPTWAKRVEGRETWELGKGVTWEGNLLYNLLYETKLVTKKVVLVGWDKGPVEVPLVIRGRHRHSLPSGLASLVGTLHGDTAVLPPVTPRAPTPSFASSTAVVDSAAHPQPSRSLSRISLVTPADSASWTPLEADARRKHQAEVRQVLEGNFGFADALEEAFPGGYSTHAAGADRMETLAEALFGLNAVAVSDLISRVLDVQAGEGPTDGGPTGSDRWVVGLTRLCQLLLPGCVLFFDLGALRSHPEGSIILEVGKPATVEIAAAGVEKRPMKVRMDHGRVVSAGALVAPHENDLPLVAATVERITEVARADLVAQFGRVHAAEIKLIVADLWQAARLGRPGHWDQAKVDLKTALKRSSSKPGNPRASVLVVGADFREDEVDYLGRLWEALQGLLKNELKGSGLHCILLRGIGSEPESELEYNLKLIFDRPTEPTLR